MGNLLFMTFVLYPRSPPCSFHYSIGTGPCESEHMSAGVSSRQN